MRCHGTSRNDCSTGSKSMSETPLDIYIVILRPPTLNLVVTARRAKSKMEETKVKAMSAAATEVPSGSKELGDQIVRLMATLARAEQGSCPASAPQ